MKDEGRRTKDEGTSTVHAVDGNYNPHIHLLSCVVDLFYLNCPVSCSLKSTSIPSYSIII